MTPYELPIACSLAAAELGDRHRELAAVGRGGLIGIERRNGEPAVLSFKPEPDTLARLRRIIAAEAACCPFLDMRVSDGDPLILTIDGPADAASVVDELVSAFGAPAST